MRCSNRRGIKQWTLVIEILSSGVSLGHYVPALRMRDWLRRCGIDVRVLVYENLLSDATRAQIDKAMRAYHASFAFALAGQRLAAQLAPAPVEEQGAEVVGRWVTDPPRRIIALSGYWVPLLERFAASRPDKQDVVELCHIDTCDSPVWRARPAPFRHRWLASADAERVLSYIPASTGHLPRNRCPRVVVHGGGWGIGEYRTVVTELLEHGIEIDLVAYLEDDAREADRRAGLRYLAIAPGWRPWHLQDDGEPTYPPVVEVTAGAVPARTTPALRHELLDYIAVASAIVSKPGGATLVDSFSTCTPVAFLTPYGQHESTNASLWQTLGYGITIERWRAENFSLDALAPLRRNLERDRRSTPVCPDGTDAAGR